jgi:hypothetical protein
MVAIMGGLLSTAMVAAGVSISRRFSGASVDLIGNIFSGVRE